MARIDWAVVCDHAYLDRHDQLCMIGVVRSLQAPQLPLVAHRLMLVARLADIQPVDEVQFALGVVTPRGLHIARPGSDNLLIEMAGEYVLATLRDVRLCEEGVYRFQIQLRGQPVVAVQVPLMAAQVEPEAIVQ